MKPSSPTIYRHFSSSRCPATNSIFACHLISPSLLLTQPKTGCLLPRCHALRRAHRQHGPEHEQHNSQIKSLPRRHPRQSGAKAPARRPRRRHPQEAAAGLGRDGRAGRGNSEGTGADIPRAAQWPDPGRAQHRPPGVSRAVHR